MSRMTTILTGLVLLSQTSAAVAQTGAVKNKGMEQLFSTVRRTSPSAATADPPGAGLPIAEERVILLRSSCEKIIKEGSWISYGNDRIGKMKLQLRGIYTQGSVLYFLLRLKNRSSLDYDIEAIHFSIAGTPGKSSTGIRELPPIYLYDSNSVIRGYSHSSNVVVLPKFTLPAGRRLMIEVIEKNGGRHLRLMAGNFMLERARIL
ncbi:DUF4138 domain-containing protein [Puia sp. P3]|uniref:DUF4138 domain-containing protein n=1 Tax=Puia sp. P3 TaxID=3423952 RepID=UPI003D677A90